MLSYLREKGDLPYICSRSVTSDGIPWPKRSDVSAPHVFPKPVSKVGNTPYAKVGSRLDTIPNYTTTSTMSITCPPVVCSA
ncbi:hypothetical protein TNCV_3485541 [Trichonephila clavipes]|nr:hypothetical protein TNCV_3485541 [Trichonephila clavipes]